MSKLTNVIIFCAGAAAGAVGTFLYMKLKCDALLDEQAQSLAHLYSVRNRAIADEEEREDDDELIDRPTCHICDTDHEFEDSVRCDRCRMTFARPWEPFKYCPNCGARVVRDDDEDDDDDDWFRSQNQEDGVLKTYNIFDNDEYTKEDYTPYFIDQNEYDSMTAQFGYIDTTELTIYTNGIVLDDMNDIVDHVEDCLGEGNLQRIMQKELSDSYIFNPDPARHRIYHVVLSNEPMIIKPPLNVTFEEASTDGLMTIQTSYDYVNDVIYYDDDEGEFEDMHFLNEVGKCVRDMIEKGEISAIEGSSVYFRDEYKYIDYAVLLTEPAL